jgi:hypothetical protein
MTIDYKYLRSLTGPQPQSEGEDVARYPTWNFGEGFIFTPEPAVARHTISLDLESIGDQLTGSLNSVVRQGNYLCVGAGSLVHLTGSTGDVVQARGRTTVNDGGQGYFAWDDSATHDGGLVFGKWKRLWDQRTIKTEWFGLDKTGATDIRAPLQAILDASTSQPGVTVELGFSSNYVISGALRLNTRMDLKGASAEGTVFGGTAITYVGPTDYRGTGSMLDCRTSGFKVRDIQLNVAVGRRLTSIVGYNASGLTQGYFENVVASCYSFNGNIGWYPPASGSNVTGSADFGYLIGSGSVGNSDCLHVNRGFVYSPTRAAFAFAANGQPYNMVFDHVRCHNYIGVWQSASKTWADGQPGAYGALFEQLESGVYGGISVRDMEVEYYGTLFKNFTSTFPTIVIDKLECEVMKKMWYTPGFSGGSTNATWQGGRFDTTGLGLPTYLLDGTLEHSASDKRVIYDIGGTNHTLLGCHVGDITPHLTDEATTFQVGANGSLTMIGCTIPNGVDPVRQIALVNNDGMSNSGVYIQGCKALASGSVSSLGPIVRPIPDRNGCVNADGLITISDTTTTGSVALTQDEWGNGGAGNDGAVGPRYLVLLTPVSSSGVPPRTAFNAYVPNASVGRNGFDVVLDTAPGSGRSVTFMYSLRPNRTGVRS